MRAVLSSTPERCSTVLLLLLLLRRLLLRRLLNAAALMLPSLVLLLQLLLLDPETRDCALSMFAALPLQMLSVPAISMPHAAVASQLVSAAQQHRSACCMRVNECVSAVSGVAPSQFSSLLPQAIILLPPMPMALIRPHSLHPSFVSRCLRCLSPFVRLVSIHHCAPLSIVSMIDACRGRCE